jgi:protein O-GlcNAc transferase
MAAMGLGQALRAALDLLGAGRAAEAEELCRRIIDAAPDSPDAAGVRGMALARLGRPSDAAMAFLRAACLDLRRADAAQTAFGLIREHLRDRGAVIKAALCAAPGDADLWRLLTTTAEYAETSPPTLRLLIRVVRLDPMQQATLLRLAGMTAESEEKFDAADRVFQAALTVEPGSSAAWFNRALTATRCGEPWREIAALSARRAAQAAPFDVEMLVFLARHRLVAGVGDGYGMLCRAAALDPAHREAWRLSAVSRGADGRPEDAAVCRRRLYRLTADAADGARLQLTLNLTDASPQTIKAAACDWAAAHAEPLTRRAPPAFSTYRGNRPLRVGYLTDALFTLDVTLLPLIEAHTSAVEATVYALRESSREHAGRYRAAARRYRDCSGLEAAAVAEIIRRDEIDLLVEGVGFPLNHPGLNVLAHRPAPVQAHFPVMTTTGMSAVDACLVDATTAPPGAEEGFVERLVRLPVGYFRAVPNDLPAIATRNGGGVVFGSFNTLNKIGAPLLRTWAEILQRTPDARLLIKASDMTLAGEARLRGALSGQWGVAADRLEIRSPVPGYQAHLEMFNQIDIHLDSFPYGGVTTTVEALWMGRPVVTLAGHRVLDRYSASFLTVLGLENLVAGDAAEYARIACALAADKERRADLRRRLRADVAASPLGDVGAFSTALEEAYFQLLRDVCAHQRRQTAR